jgi:hypothetical protein
MHTITDLPTIPISSFIKPDTHSSRLDRRERRNRLDRVRERDQRARSRRTTQALLAEAHEDLAYVARC